MTWKEDTEEEAERMRELVRAHHVRFSSQPLRSADMIPIGFVIDIFASPSEAPHLVVPGCELCPPVRSALRALVHHALPNGPRTFFEVHFPISVAYHDSEGQLSASIEVLHQSGANAPLDDCENACRDEIVRRLRALGAREQT